MAYYDKLIRALQTKSELKDALNDYGGNITDETVFREYPNIARSLLESIGGGGDGKGVFIREVEDLECDVVFDSVVTSGLAEFVDYKMDVVMEIENAADLHGANVTVMHPVDIYNQIEVAPYLNYVNWTEIDPIYLYSKIENAAYEVAVQDVGLNQSIKTNSNISAELFIYKYYRLSDLNQRLSEYKNLTLSEMNFRKV